MQIRMVTGPKVEFFSRTGKSYRIPLTHRAYKVPTANSCSWAFRHTCVISDARKNPFQGFLI